MNYEQARDLGREHMSLLGTLASQLLVAHVEKYGIPHDNETMQAASNKAILLANIHCMKFSEIVEADSERLRQEYGETDGED